VSALPEQTPPPERRPRHHHSNRWGDIRVERVRGYCQRGKKWRFPADALLGLPEEGTPSPGVQEIAALTVSKMPAPEVSVDGASVRVGRRTLTFDGQKVVMQ
jgi:hypothetical protein